MKEHKAHMRLAVDSPDFENASDEEIEAYLASVAARRNMEPSEWQRSGGAAWDLSLVMLLAGLVGMAASLGLVLDQITLLKDPSAALACDINPLIGCSTFLRSDFNTVLFGIPNALWGLMFFAGITALGLVCVFRTPLSVWIWRLLSLSMVGATVWLVWFQWTALHVEHSLCPYCLVVWSVTIPLIVNVWARAAQSGWIPAPPRLGRSAARYRWLITGIVYLVLVGLIVVTFKDSWSYVL